MGGFWNLDITSTDLNMTLQDLWPSRSCSPIHGLLWIPCWGSQISLGATRFVLLFKTSRPSNPQPTPTTTTHHRAASKEPPVKAMEQTTALAHTSKVLTIRIPNMTTNSTTTRISHTTPLQPGLLRLPLELRQKNLQLRGHSYRQAPQTRHVQQGPEASQSLEASRLGHDGSRRGYQQYARITN